MLKMGGYVQNSDYSNELQGFKRCKQFLNDQNTLYHLKKKFVHGIISVLLPASMSSHKAEHFGVPIWR